jgi:hypothetical protein
LIVSWLYSEDTTGMNHLKIVSLKRWYLNTRMYGVTVRITAILIVTTGRTSNLTDPTIKKDCLGKAEYVNLWLWDQNQNWNQWRALASKVTKLRFYIKCLEFLGSLGNYCLLKRECPRRQSDISHCLAWKGTLSTMHHTVSPGDSFFSPCTGTQNRYERITKKKSFSLISLFCLLRRKCTWCKKPFPNPHYVLGWKGSANYRRRFLGQFVKYLFPLYFGQHLCTYILYSSQWRHEVAHLVEVLHYKPKVAGSIPDRGSEGGVGLKTLPPSHAVSESGSLNLLEPSGPAIGLYRGFRYLYHTLYTETTKANVNFAVRWHHPWWRWWQWW